jgi:hypothetical protein
LYPKQRFIFVHHPSKEYMKEKMEHTITGCFFSLLNIVLIDTRFALVGLFFGLVSIFFFIKALLISK